MAGEQRQLRVSAPNDDPAMVQLARQAEANVQEVFQMMNNLSARLDEIESRLITLEAFH